METIIECDEHNVKHEYLTGLPQTSIQIKSIFGHELKCLRYWFDYKSLRIVSKTSKKHKYPYLYLRGDVVKFNFKDIGEKNYSTEQVIHALNACYQKRFPNE